jgi:small subunit ribosomal protein S6
MTKDEPRNYETTFIVNPDLTEEEHQQKVKKFTDMIKEHGGEIINQEIWGMRKLAYEIERKNHGFYVFTEFKARPSMIAELERQYEIDETIIRWLTIQLGKYAVQYNEKRRTKLKNQSAQTQAQS